MRKKILFIFIALITLISFKSVSALSLGVSTSEDYDGASSPGDSTIITRGGAKSPIVLIFGEFWGDNPSLIKKIHIHLNLPEGFSAISSATEVGTMTGSGSDYDITFGADATADGSAHIDLRLPTPSKSTKYNLTGTATSYGEGDAVLESSSISVQYFILVKNPSDCDSNSDYTITTSVGTPQKIGEFFGQNYAISTDKDKVDITINTSSSKATVLYGKGGTISNNMPVLSNKKLTGVSLNYGSNEFAFIIQSECAQQYDALAQEFSGGMMVGIDLSDYQVSPAIAGLDVTRNDTRSKVNTLSSLSISNAKINFKPDLKTYMATVDYDVDSVKISSTLTDSKARYVDGYGNRTVNLKEGVNDVLVKVRAENGAEATYTIKITRSPSDDASLKKLTVNGKEVVLKKDTLLYSAYVDNKITKAEIKAEPTNEKAKVEIEEVKELKEGNNKISITVTASSGKKNIYVVNIIRDKLVSENSRLKTLNVKGHPFTFHPDTLEYTIPLEKDEDKLELTIETEHNAAKYMVVGNKNLKNGSTIKIKVTAQDQKSTTSYILHIEKEEGHVGLIIGIVVAIFIGFGIFGFFFTKKKKKTISAPPLENRYAVESDTKPVVPETQPSEVPETRLTTFLGKHPEEEVPSTPESSDDEKPSEFSGREY